MTDREHELLLNREYEQFAIITGRDLKAEELGWVHGLAFAHNQNPYAEGTVSWEGYENYYKSGRKNYLEYFKK